MFSTSEFYSYCRVHDVDVIPFDRLPAAATTVRYHGAYAVGLNFSRLHTVRQMRTAMLHESGHLRTGALHKVGLYRRLNACTNSRQILFFYPHIRFKRTTSKFRSLTLATAAKIADHFGVRIDDLVEHS